MHREFKGAKVRLMMVRYMAQADRLLEDWGLELQVFGVINSQWMLLSSKPISLSSWQTALEKQVRLLPGPSTSF